MLSYRHPKASCLRIVDELPAVLFSYLLDGQALIFEGIPEPTRIELETWLRKESRDAETKDTKRPDPLVWGRHLGINTGYDLPSDAPEDARAGKHSDKNIRLPHYPEDLDARLRKIRSAGRTAIEESGANMLYMAFGFLEWRDSSSSERSYLAPLLLMPVEIIREPTRQGHYRNRVKWTGEEVQQNLSLRKKLEEFSISVPEPEEEIDIESYFQQVSEAIKSKQGWQVRRYLTLGLFEFGKILLYLDLDPARWPDDEQISDHPLVKDILEGRADERVGEPSEADYSDDAIRFRDLGLELVDRADSSQAEALHTALMGNNMVIEGPPGTGKSQTITNLVAAALAQGKTVLFVAEKLAALEVVRRRLRELGLSEFCFELHSHKTKKTEALEDIADRLRRSVPKHSDTAAKAAIQRLTERRQQLESYLSIISEQVGSMEGLTVSETLMQAGRARRRLGAGATTIDKLGLKLKDPSKLSWTKFGNTITRLNQFKAAMDELGVDAAYKHPWSGVSSLKVLPHDAGALAEQAVAWADSADALIQAITAIGFPHSIESGFDEISEKLDLLSSVKPDFDELEDATRTAEKVLSAELPRATDGAILAGEIYRLASAAPLVELETAPASALERGALQMLQTHHERLQKMRSTHSLLSSIFKESALETPADDIEEWLAGLSQSGLFRRWSKPWRQAMRAWAALSRPAERKRKPAICFGAFQQLLEFVREHKAIRSDDRLKFKFGAAVCELNFNVQPLILAAGWADAAYACLPQNLAANLTRTPAKILAALASQASQACEAALQVVSHQFETRASTYWESLVRDMLPAQVSSPILAAADASTLSEICEAFRKCAACEATLGPIEQAFATAADLNPEQWYSGHAKLDLKTTANRARFASINADCLSKWLDFDRALRHCLDHIEAPVTQATAASLISADQISLVFEYLLFDALSRDVFQRSPDLHKISGKSLNTLRDEYRSIDSEVMELRRIVIAARLLTRKPSEGKSSGLKSQLTEMALIRAELAKQKKHIPLRQLVARAGNALQALKPCFMMGPLSVAQYIAPGTLKFDLVVMDEASQMRPEDAIGALARGGQAVIVGDPKQLPPTSFFERVSGGLDDTDDDGLLLAEDTKSVLELASSIFEGRMLKWHYRSRHESLIAFSNQTFYKNELIVFPSPSGQAGRFGVGWTFVPDGVATGGVNSAEARRVAAVAARLLLEQSERSLGIVAMNVKQAERIADELTALANSDQLLANAVAKAENDGRGEPFFIKNLENVQGDERDIILISMTYGPSTSGGKVPQNFGPINRDTGWRRLNVLFTRAKERMEIVSSMRAVDIIPKEGTDRGPRSLKLFLDYAEHGRLGRESIISDRPTGSEFEDAVIEGLTELGFKCVPQVGVANFFLDIGIEDPDWPGEFVAAIECDGAAYHSTKSARDRDRLRQEILENLGWNIIRIWSTDWFRTPHDELRRVAGELNALIEVRRQRYARITGLKKQPELARSPKLKVALKSEQGVTASTRESISADQARSMLVDLRERVIKPKYPDSDPARGLLRKGMLDELLRKRPTDIDEFRTSIRLELREATDASQVKEFGDQVFDILATLELSYAP